MSTTTTSRTPNVELQLALAAVLAGHHDPTQAGRQRAAAVQSRVTNALALLAAVVAMYDVLLVLRGVI